MTYIIGPPLGSIALKLNQLLNFLKVAVIFYSFYLNSVTWRMEKNVEQLGTRDPVLSVKATKPQANVYSEPSVVHKQWQCPHCWVTEVQGQPNGDPKPKLLN